jgi:hypothetical protein
MQLQSTSFVGSSMGQLGVVGTLPAVAVAVSVLHAKKAISGHVQAAGGGKLCWVVLKGVFGSAQ